jgi:glycosyltransferase involved in cell wall biosynthesis
MNTWLPGTGGVVASAVIPAYREAQRVGATVRAALRALEGAGLPAEVLVVDDGSPDDTAAVAAAAGARVMRLPRNRGKGAALAAGLAAARGSLLVLLDADLGDSAEEAGRLLGPVLSGEAEMTVARLPAAGGGGFGLVRRLAVWGLRRAGAPPLQAPLSGQRVLSRAAWERIGRLDAGFGLEMGLNLDAARLGLRVVEVETAMTHRLTGRTPAGFLHRGRQLVDIARVLHRRGLLRPGAPPAGPHSGGAPP